MVDFVPQWWQHRPAVTPDGTVAYFGGQISDAATRRLAVFDVGEGAVTHAITADDFRQGGVAAGHAPPPAGLTSPAIPTMSTDGQTVFVATQAFTQPLWRVEVASNAVSPLATSQMTAVDIVAAPDGDHAFVLVLNLTDLLHAMDIVDVHSGAIVASARFSNEGIAHQMALTSDGKRLCVLELDLSSPPKPGKLIVVDTATALAGGTMPFDPGYTVGINPQAVAASADRAYVANANTDTGTVNEIGLPPGGFLRETPLGFGVKPSGIAVTTQGDWLYVSNAKANTIALYEGRGMQLVDDAIAVGGSPSAMAISKDDRVLCVRIADAPGMATLRVPPVVLELQPPTLPCPVDPSGGRVRIVGTSLDDAIQVLFGDTPATIVGPGPGAVGTTLDVIAPPPSGETFWVTVQTAAGTSTVAGHVESLFQYIPSPAITELRPPAGPLAGTSVQIVGSTLGAADAVLFGTTVITAITVDPDGGMVTFTAPSNQAGPVSVAVRTPTLTSNALPFTYFPAPTVASVEPDISPLAGRAVEIHGTGLTALGLPTVLFGTSSATHVEVVAGSNGTLLLAAAPSHAVGDAAVTVATPGGISAATPFRYAPVPAVNTLDPAAGPLTGGTVTVVGTGLRDATSIAFGDAPLAVVGTATDTRLQFVAPPHAAGPVSVVVRSPGGASAAATFTYFPVPTVTTLAPDVSPLAGTAVEIHGTGLTALGLPEVVFGTSAASHIEVVGNQGILLRAVAPPHDAGAVNVTVGTPGGTSAATPFRYVPVPSITGLDPAAGPLSGGAVAIRGTGLRDATSVTFDGADLSVVGTPTDNALQIVVPQHAAGAVAVVVNGPGGASAAAAFTYAPVPVIEALDPPAGPLTGGGLDVRGSGFAAATSVTVDGVAVAPFGTPSDTDLRLTMPAHAAGPVAVVVHSPGGTSAAATFTYDPVPGIDALNPAAGPLGGGAVAVAGTGLRGATSVTFGGTELTDLGTPTDTALQIVAPPHAAGSVLVVVHSPGGTSAAASFAYDPPPTIDALDPVAGPLDGTVLNIQGSGLAAATSVTINGVAVPGLGTVTDTGIELTMPPHAVGPVAVAVHSPGGDSAAATFTYDPVPTITVLDPAAGPPTGLQVRIAGTGLRDATAVIVDGVAVTDLGVPTETGIQFALPAHAAGAVPVVVRSPGGDSAAVVFTYVPPPLLTSLSPSSTAEGQTVSLIGRNLGPVTAVRFGGTVIVELEHSGLGTTIDVRVPSGAGAVTVTASSAGGISNPLTFTYT